MKTRMYSSRMRNVHSSSHLGGGGEVSAQGGCLPRGCLPRGLLPGGCLPRREVSAQGVSAQGCLPRGVSAQGSVCPGGRGCLPRRSAEGGICHLLCEQNHRLPVKT